MGIFPCRHKYTEVRAYDNSPCGRLYIMGCEKCGDLVESQREDHVFGQWKVFNRPTTAPRVPAGFFGSAAEEYKGSALPLGSVVMERFCSECGERQAEVQ